MPTTVVKSAPRLARLKAVGAAQGVREDARLVARRALHVRQKVQSAKRVRLSAGLCQRVHAGVEACLEPRAAAGANVGERAPHPCLERRCRCGGALKDVRLVVEEGHAQLIVFRELVKDGEDARLGRVELAPPATPCSSATGCPVRVVVAREGAAHRARDVEKHDQ